MKKMIFVLLFILCAGIAYAENVQMNYSIEVHTTNGTPGRFQLTVDGVDWGNGVCDGYTAISPRVQIVKNVNCGDVERGTVDTLADDMRLLVHKFNDTRVYCMQPYQDCSTQLSNCKISNQHQVELLENCNGSNSDWYQLYRDAQNDLNNVRAKTCYDQIYIDNLKKDYDNKIYWAIGCTAALVGSIAYALYFKKGLAQMPHHKI